jgi:lantibiotic modifying enzyme
MAYTDQQRWITVQQKTFTKWLNTKVEARDIVVKDLIADLSDGVCGFILFFVRGGFLKSAY